VGVLEPHRLKTRSGPAHAGTAFDGKHLFQIFEKRIQKIDPETGKILRTIESNRFVTGVTWVDGELWHGTWEGDESELRRIDPRTGQVLEELKMPPGVARAVRRLRRGSAASGGS
jgi:glutamine cyclotransferase